MVFGTIAVLYMYVRMALVLSGNAGAQSVVWSQEHIVWQALVIAGWLASNTAIFILCCVFLRRVTRGLGAGTAFPKENVPLIYAGGVLFAARQFFNMNLEDVLGGVSNFIIDVDVATVLSMLVIFLFAMLYKFAAEASEDSRLAI